MSNYPNGVFVFVPSTGFSFPGWEFLAKKMPEFLGSGRCYFNGFAGIGLVKLPEKIQHKKYQPNITQRFCFSFYPLS
jgi:hypothetical protein